MNRWTFALNCCGSIMNVPTHNSIRGSCVSRWWEPASLKRNHDTTVSPNNVALKCCDLSVDHSVEIQLTATRKGKMLRHIRECFRMRGISNRRH